MYQDYYKKNQEQITKDYFTFLKFKSISSEPEFAPEVRACANWLNGVIQTCGLQTEIWETSGHPVIFASNLEAGPDKPTLLIYNHYDVQPVDPLEEWESPPFEPTVRGGQVYARGAQDNKGQCFYVIQALKAIYALEKKFPINIKLCIEGEEEFASTGLSKILPSKREELKADYLAIVDLGIKDQNHPALTLGVRGLVTMDLEIEDSNTDLHSGGLGGIVYNPIHALVELLAKLRGADGKILVPHFYDRVEALTPDEKKQLNFDFNENEFQKNFGTTALGGEKAFSPLERAWVRPTIEINGIAGGYAGSGFKTVIPAKAHAKISCRLVPGQDPEKIGELVSRFLKENAPKGMKVSVDLHRGTGKALRSNPNSKAVHAFAKGYEAVYQKPCGFILQGGSIPIVTELAEASTGEPVLLGLGLPGDKIHAPNEHFGLDRLEKGFLIMVEAIKTFVSYSEIS